jgi:hypothetical protein
MVTDRVHHLQRHCEDQRHRLHQGQVVSAPIQVG